MPDPVVPAAAPAAPAAPAPASRTGMEAALSLLGGLSGTPAPAPAPAAPAAPAAAKPPEIDPAARAIAVNARKERELLDKQRTLKAQEAKLAETQKQLEARMAELDQRLKGLGETQAQRDARKLEYLKNPRLALEDAGLTYEQLTQAILNEGAPSPELLARAMEAKVAAVQQSTQKELEALKAQQAEERKQAEEAQRKAQEAEREQAIQAIHDEIGDVIQSNPEKFEMIAHFKAQALVFRAIEEHYKETGQELSPMQAAEKVEKYLDSEVERLKDTKRWKPRFGEPAPAPAPAPTTLGNLPPAPTTPVRKGGAPDYDAALKVLQGTKY